MPVFVLNFCYSALCVALVLSFRTRTSFGQVDDVATSAPSARLIRAFFFVANRRGHRTTEVHGRRFAEISERVKAATVNIKIDGSQGPVSWFRATATY